MKQTLITGFIVDLIIQLAVYIFRVVILWDFPNPFDWLLNFPKYSPEDRGIIFFFLVFYKLVQILVIHLNKDQKY